MDQNHDIIAGQDVFDLTHKGRFIQSCRMVMVFHQAWHQRQVIFRMLTPRIRQREHSHVQLTPGHWLVLFFGLKQRSRRKNLDRQIHICRRHFIRDDLRNLVAHIRR
jgi:hypothetical protein